MSVTQWMCVLAAFACIAQTAPTSTAHALSHGSTVLCRSFLQRRWLSAASVAAVVLCGTPTSRTPCVSGICRNCKRLCTYPSTDPRMCAPCFNQKLGERLDELARTRAYGDRAGQSEEELERARLMLEDIRTRRGKYKR